MTQNNKNVHNVQITFSHNLQEKSKYSAYLLHNNQIAPYNDEFEVLYNKHTTEIWEQTYLNSNLLSNYQNIILTLSLLYKAKG